MTATDVSTTRSSSLGRSIWAVVAGLLINIIPAVTIDTVLHRANVFPPRGRMTDGMCLLASSYRYILGFISGYVVARLAPDRPLKHAVMLGAIGVVMSSAGTITMWDAGPHWYALALVVLAMPLALAGWKVSGRS
jgi:hypothetical protein